MQDRSPSFSSNTRYSVLYIMDIYARPTLSRRLAVAHRAAYGKGAVDSVQGAGAAQNGGAQMKGISFKTWDMAVGGDADMIDDETLLTAEDLVKPKVPSAVSLESGASAVLLRYL